MPSEPADLATIVKLLESLRGDVAHLTDRVAELEGQPRGAPAASVVAAKPGPVVLDDELVAVISAAVAAFLGVKPRIRQIRLVPSGTWAEQGRATIQASHKLVVQHN